MEQYDTISSIKGRAAAELLKAGVPTYITIWNKRSSRWRNGDHIDWYTMALVQSVPGEVPHSIYADNHLGLGDWVYWHDIARHLDEDGIEIKVTRVGDRLQYHIQYQAPSNTKKGLMAYLRSSPLSTLCMKPFTKSTNCNHLSQ